MFVSVCLFPCMQCAVVVAGVSAVSVWTAGRITLFSHDFQSLNEQSLFLDLEVLLPPGQLCFPDTPPSTLFRPLNMLTFSLQCPSSPNTPAGKGAPPSTVIDGKLAHSDEQTSSVPRDMNNSEFNAVHCWHEQPQ